MKSCKLWLITVLLVASTACANRPVAYVAVREAEFRSESGRDDRIKLPLTVAARDRLILFLRAGGDNNHIGREIVDADAERRYSSLLDALADPKNLALEDLTTGQTFKKWFPKAPIRQVIDAREPSPPALEPVAATDGRYWWVFYTRQKQLTELLVIKAIPTSMKR